MAETQTPKNNNHRITVTKKSQGYGPVSAILVTLIIYFGTQLIAGFLIGLFLNLTGKNFDEISDSINASVGIGFSFILIAEVLSFWFLWRFLRYRKVPWGEIGVKKPRLENILFALPAFVAYFLILVVTVALIQGLTSVDTEQKQQIGFENASGLLPLALVFISLVLLPAIVEEIMVRGFLYSGLVKKYSKKISALVASLIFAVAHLQLGSGEPPLWIAAVDTFILSIVLIYLREKTGNIWAGVAVHMMKNSLAFVSLFLIRLT